MTVVPVLQKNRPSGRFLLFSVLLHPYRSNHYTGDNNRGTEQAIPNSLFAEHKPAAKNRYQYAGLLDERHHGYTTLSHTVRKEQGTVADHEQDT